VDFKKRSNKKKDESGIALFMVVAAMTVLSVLVTEFTYVAQVNQRIAYDGLDQVKALYLAKSAFKLSLLRLKAYKQIKDLFGGSPKKDGKSSGLNLLVPRSVLDKIWNFPFIYPIPGIMVTDPGQKEQINAFQTASGLDGNFSSVIQSESNKYNLNMILAPFAPKLEPESEEGEDKEDDKNDEIVVEDETPKTSPSPSPSPTFSVEAARKSLQDYLNQILENKFQNDEDFAEEYRDLRLDELVDNIIAWADRSYEPRSPINEELIPLKRAPFYSLSELRMIDKLDDNLFNLFAPSLTVSATPGINVNTIETTVLGALVPGINKEESDEFFKHRDSEIEDNSFKKPEDFFNYLRDNIAIFNRDDKEIGRYKDDLRKKNIRIITDESNFRIIVEARVNQAVKRIEAAVTLLGDEEKPEKNGSKTSAPTVPPHLPVVDEETFTPAAKTGLKITFMRVL